MGPTANGVQGEIGGSASRLEVGAYASRPLSPELEALDKALQRRKRGEASEEEVFEAARRIARAHPAHAYQKPLG